MDWKQLSIGLVITGLGLSAMGCGRSAAPPSTSKNEARLPADVTSDSNTESRTTTAEAAPPTIPISANNQSPSNARPAAPEKIPEPRVGSGANDFYFFTKIRGRIASDNDFKDTQILVDVKDGVVKLTGLVTNAAQKDKAQQIAKDVEGIKSVKNQLVVRVPGRKSPAANDPASQPVK